MRKKIFTFLLALAASIGMMWAETVVVINKSEFTSSGVTKEGVTLALSSGSMTSSDPLAMDGSFEFSTSLGKFTGITIETDANIMQIYEGAYTSAGWPTGQNLGTSAAWTGESETVLISCMVAGMNTITITCTIEPASAAGIPCTAEDLGKVLCTDGSIYATVSEATAASKTAVAMIAYVDTENGKALALALADESGTMDWETAKTTAAAHTPAVSGGTWTLASKDDWNNMITAAGDYTALRDGFSAVGGTNMQQAAYWSSTPENANAWRYYFTYGGMWTDGYVDNPCRVRACLTFDIPAGGGSEPVVLADCGLGWLNVPEGGVVGTIGHEDEIVLPQVNASLDFILAFQAHTATLRLGSTDESVLAVYGFNNFAVNGVGECDVYVVHDEDAVFAYDSAAFHVTVNPEPAPQPQIGPKEVLDLGTTGCVGEHYQLTGGGTNIYRTVGGVDDKMITIESLHGEIIDNISLKLYYYNVWTGYSVAASSGDVSSWNYNAYEDLVITNINATSVTLSRVGSGQENGYVMFEKVTINNSDEPQPQPAEDVDITPNVDPENPTVYYSTFYDSANKYALPDGVEAYVATRDGANLLLSKIADAGQTIPADNAVILKSTVTPFTLSISDAEPVDFNAINSLEGTDESIATPANCYVLAGNDGVGFYHYTASMLNPHKAYVIYSGSQAPHRMPFVFNQATGMENVQGDNAQSTKVIENGQLIIIKNGVKYNAQGQIVK